MWRVALLLILWCAVPLWAQPDQGGGVDLTPHQKKALRAIQNRYRGRINDLQIRLESRRLELAQLLQQDDTEKEALQGKLAEILDLEKERQNLSLDQIFECKQQLTPAQWGPYRRRLLRFFLERHKGGQFPKRGSNRSSP